MPNLRHAMMGAAGSGGAAGGTLWTWGGNGGGAGGRGTAPYGKNVSSPTQIGELATWAYLKICGNRGLNAAVKDDGTLWMWGYNTSGGVGDQTVISRSSPVQIGSLTDWGEPKMMAGDTASFVIKTDGTFWSWSAGYQGRTGHGDTLNRSSPTQIGSLTTWAQVAMGSAHVLALRTDGTLWCFGQGNEGALGLGSTVDASSPTQIGSLTTWAAVGTGVAMSVAIKTDGTLWSWGKNNNGQLGQGDVINRSSPVQVGSLTDWSTIDAADNWTVAYKSDSSIWVWGKDNDAGDMAQGDSSINRSSPVQIGSLTTWESVTAGKLTGGALKG